MNYSPGPFSIGVCRSCDVELLDANGCVVARVTHPIHPHPNVDACDVQDANTRLLAAAPDLLREAGVLRCLATSPRFQAMHVREALAELAANGCGHDGGAALAAAGGAA